MKLYEFTYTDNQKLNESSLLRRIQTMLESEALSQDWAPGYTLRQCLPPEQTASGINYFYQVVGRYMDSEGVESDAGADVNFIGSILDPVAAGEAQI